MKKGNVWFHHSDQFLKAPVKFAGNMAGMQIG
jgi:hypothetical protein